MSSPDPVRPPPWVTPGPEPEAARWGPPTFERRDDRSSPDGAGHADPVGEAYARGFDDGVARARASAATELAPVRDLLIALARELERERVVAAQDATANMAALALVVARWLFQREVTADSGVVQELVRRAVHLLPTTTSIEIRVHPADLDVMVNRLEIAEADGRPLPVHWIADPGLDRGGFTIATPERLIDGRADVALRTLYERLVTS